MQKIGMRVRPVSLSISCSPHLVTELNLPVWSEGNSLLGIEVNLDRSDLQCDGFGFIRDFHRLFVSSHT
jgi:hypothetical protein